MSCQNRLLMEKKLIPFLDQKCLVFGADWEDGFLQGLKNAAFVVLLVSEDGLKGIEMADKRQDNVLLEYEFALRQREKSLVHVYPVWIGKQENGSFKPFGFPGNWPDAEHKVNSGKGENIKHTMEQLYKIQGFKLLTPDDPEQVIGNIKAQILKEMKKSAPKEESQETTSPKQTDTTSPKQTETTSPKQTDTTSPKDQKQSPQKTQQDGGESGDGGGGQSPSGYGGNQLNSNPMMGNNPMLGNPMMGFGNMGNVGNMFGSGFGGLGGMPTGYPQQRQQFPQQQFPQQQFPQQQFQQQPRSPQSTDVHQLMAQMRGTTLQNQFGGMNLPEGFPR